ncbi:MAG: flagellar hook-associated protein FlgK [Cellulosilyticaceae bacterium]
MGSAFFELNIGTTGLFAAQRGLAVTSNNITNMQSPGYTRQVLNQKASNALPGFGKGMVGTGVETTSINRIRDSYLDRKLWSQNDTLGEYSIKTQQNLLVESVFGEPSDVGFTKVFGDLFKAIDDISKLPGESERQQALRQTMDSFTKYFNSASTKLEQFQRDLNFEVKATVEEVNMLAGRVQSLNRQIYQSEMHGDMANTLRDERDLVLDRLSKIINIEAKEVQVEGPDGKMENHFVVSANGQTLVDHFQVRFLDVVPRESGAANKKNPEDVDGLYDIVWEDRLPFDMSDHNLSGELKGLIDMRDGRGTTIIAGTPPKETEVKYSGIPYYIHKMDKFVQTFAEKLNGVYNQKREPDGTLTQIDPPYHLFGYDADGDGKPDTGKVDYSKMTAKNFTLSPEIFASASNIRSNYEHDPLYYFTTPKPSDPPPGGHNPNPSNNDLLMDLLGQKDDGKMFKEGNPKDFMISMFSELGINTQEAKLYQKSQENITQTIDLQRKSISQVDQNEEFMNLVKYQQAYQVAAKIINTMDGIYETTIFRLGAS